MNNEELLLTNLQELHKKIDSIDCRVRDVEQRINNGLSENVQRIVNQTTAQENRLLEVEKKHQRERIQREARERRWRIFKVIATVGISAGLLVVGIVGL